MFSRTLAHVVTAVMAALLAGCGGGSDGGGDLNTLSVGTIFKPDSLDAAGMNDTVLMYLQPVYDTLLREAPDATLEPSLATDWSYDATRTVLTLKLRTDVTFTDGTTFDAQAARANLLRFRDGISAAASVLGKVKDVEAVNPETVRIMLSQPDPGLLVFLARSAGAQASPAAFDNPDLKTNPVGSGPYVLDTKATVIGSKYVYAQNPDYWDKKQQHYTKLIINAYDNPTTMLNAIKAGQLNGAQVDPVIEDQVKQAGFDLTGIESTWVGLAFLDRDGKLDRAIGNLKVRQAIIQAIDREALLKAADKGLGTPTNQIFTPTSAAYDPALDERYPYDPVAAKRLLAEAGYADGVTINMPQIAAAPAVIFDLVKQYLSDVGIKVEYTQLTSANMVPELLAAKYALSWVRLGGEPTAWQTAAVVLPETGAFNPFRVRDDQIEGFLHTMQTASEADAGSAAKALNKYVVDQALFNPWYRPQSFFATDANTSVDVQSDYNFPFLWNIKPKG